MAPRTKLRITMTAREVVAAGAPFRAWQKPFADPDVALDEISTLRPNVEPLVLRVAAVGGSERSRKKVVGDWFCDADGSAPSRLPTPEWNHDEWSRTWSRSRTWLDAWEDSKDARWMLHAAAEVWVGQRLIVRAACACARTSLHLVPVGDDRPLRAIEMAEAWSRGGASRQAVRAMAQADDPGLSAANAAYAAAFAVYSGTVAGPASYAAWCAAHARYRYRSDPDPDAVDAELADLVRANIPTADVLLAAATAASRAGER